jgi:hypothetical protein
MSTIVFVSQRAPERHLISEQIFKYHPDTATKEQIINDLKKHLGSSLEHLIIDLDVKVTLKEYDTNHPSPDKNQCYQEYSSTKKEG